MADHFSQIAAGVSLNTTN